jgi:predicted helicase
MVAVMLGDMNENEFKDFCAKVLKWLGYREVEVVSGRPDFWGDIRLVSPKGKRVMVLCVHRLGRDVERDEIYSFCEALLNSLYDKGIIICTGRLSRDAMEVIDSLSGRVEVWGLPRFREMANEAGVTRGNDLRYRGCCVACYDKR